MTTRRAMAMAPPLVLVAAALMCAGCGPDVVGAAATTAAAQAAQLKQAQQEKEQAEAQVRAIEQQQLQRAEAIDKQVERNGQ